jgi:hypothetical protein
MSRLTVLILVVFAAAAVHAQKADKPIASTVPLPVLNVTGNGIGAYTAIPSGPDVELDEENVPVYRWPVYANTEYRVKGPVVPSADGVPKGPGDDPWNPIEITSLPYSAVGDNSSGTDVQNDRCEWGRPTPGVADVWYIFE